LLAAIHGAVPWQMIYQQEPAGLCNAPHSEICERPGGSRATHMLQKIGKVHSVTAIASCI